MQDVQRTVIGAVFIIGGQAAAHPTVIRMLSSVIQDV